MALLPAQFPFLLGYRLDVAYVGTGGGTAGGAATTEYRSSVRGTFVGSGGATAGGAATTAVARSYAFTGSGGGTAGGAATTDFVQLVRPTASTAGNWTAEPSGTLHGVTSDQNNSTYANLEAADAPSTLILTFSTLYAPIAGDGTLAVRAKVA
jgi:hypothetical protein